MESGVILKCVKNKVFFFNTNLMLITKQWSGYEIQIQNRKSPCVIWLFFNDFFFFFYTNFCWGVKASIPGAARWRICARADKRSRCSWRCQALAKWGSDAAVPISQPDSPPRAGACSSSMLTVCLCLTKSRRVNTPCWWQYQLPLVLHAWCSWQLNLDQCLCLEWWGLCVYNNYLNWNEFKGNGGTFGAIFYC